MAWGFFNKIKKGLKKAGKWIKDKVVKPVVNTAKTILPVAAPIIDTYIPGASSIANTVVNTADDIMNRRIRLK